MKLETILQFIKIAIAIYGLYLIKQLVNILK